MFVLLMLFLFKYIDDLIGKGFEWYTIAQLMMYASATNVAMALPLSILLSSIMTYGALGENYELVAIKSAGISLRRAMYPMVVVVGLLAVAAFIFSDYMLPIANLKYYSLLYDARQQKSANLLPEGVFSSSFPGYTIRVSKKDPDGQTLHGVMIYSKNPANNNTDVLFAKSGSMYRSPDNYLILLLKDGIQYSESPGDNNYNFRQRLTRFRFKAREQWFDLSGFKIHRTNESEFKTQVQMMNSRQLRDSSKSLIRQYNANLEQNFKLFSPYIKYFNIPRKSATVKNIAPVKDINITRLPQTQFYSAITNGMSEVRSIQDMLRNRADFSKNTAKTIRRCLVEYQRKFVLSAVCLVLFLIGAPLGAIIRKGGLGMPVVVAVVFFIIYYIISTIGEKSAKDGNLSPVIGMWISVIILTPIGLFLSYKAANDSVLFDLEAYKLFFNRLVKKRHA
jgi:lipopolysaccharide export system permease protein